MHIIEQKKCFAGQQITFSHSSERLNCSMNGSIFLPPQAQQNKVPVLYWLSGLTCTDQNFAMKAGAQQFAAQHGVAIVMPDTSPRGSDIPNTDNYDLGQGAGFYLNATEEPWRSHYQMYDYICDELPQLIAKHFTVDVTKAAIFGHSMGGHGALIIGLKNPDKYRSISAFSPICAPMQCPWGEKAFSHYLGENKNNWQQYDATYLLSNLNSAPPILIDQGSNDEFLTEQLKPYLLLEAAHRKGLTVNYREQIGYDHSYFFIASFIADHIAFHCQHLTS